MKFLLLLALFAAVLLSNGAYSETPEDTDVAEVEFDTGDDSYPAMPFPYNPDVAAPAFFAGQTFRRCVRVRCPIRCRICICRCVKFA